MIVQEASRKEEIHLNILSPYKLAFAPPFYPMWPHFHSQTELMFFYDDVDCTYVCGKTEYGLRAGDLMAVNPDQIHMCDFTSRTARICCVVAESALFKAPSAPGGRMFKNHISGDRRVRAIFEDIYASAHAKDIARELDITGLIYRLFALLTREYTEPVNGGNAFSLDRLKPVMEHINRRYFEALSTRELASVAGLSDGRFIHVFSELIGRSPTEYIDFVRISHACVTLVETDLPISDVAVRCGFNSPAYFSERFKRRTGLSPREYRGKYSKKCMKNPILLDFSYAL